MRLQGKTAVITGASKGIGQALAIGLAREGANVVAVYATDEAGGRATVEEIRQSRGQAVAFQADVSRRAEVEMVLEGALRAFGGVNVLVNSAGIAGNSPFLEISDAEWNRVLAVDLSGTFICGQVIARYMARRGGGSIINVTSQMAHVAMAGSAPYHAAKGGVEMLTRAMAVDLASFGIRVNSLAPGLTLTPMTANGSQLTDPKQRQRTLDHIPLGRPAAPQEMVGAAVFLASEESSYVTGSTLLVDGGYLAC